MEVVPCGVTGDYVTALCFLDVNPTLKLLFVGSGPYLCGWDACARTQVLPRSLILPNSHVIHGVRAWLKDSIITLLVFGQRNTRILSLKISPDLHDFVLSPQFSPHEAGSTHNNFCHWVAHSNTMHFSDWVLNANIVSHGAGIPTTATSPTTPTSIKDLPTNDSSLVVAIGFTHNYVDFWDMGLFPPRHLMRSMCHHHCLVYSMAIEQEYSGDIIVASGTAFSDILLWNPFHPESSIGLTGHSGVIYSLIYTKPTSNLEATVISVSDDRSCRSWIQTSDGQWEPKLVVYGHIARVWSVAVTRDFIISCGEDTTLRFINRQTGAFLGAVYGPLGKNVWSVASDSTGTLVASGAGDGGVRVYEITTLLDSIKGGIKVDLQLSSEPSSASPKPKSRRIKPHEYPVCMQFGGSPIPILFVVSNLNNVFNYNLTQSTMKPIMWGTAPFKVHCVGVSPSSSEAFVGGKDGSMGLFTQNSEPLIWPAHKGQIVRIFCLTLPRNILLVLSCKWTGSLKLWGLKSEPFQAIHKQTYRLPDRHIVNSQQRALHRVASCAVCDPSSSFLLVSDECNTVHCFKFDTEAPQGKNLPLWSVSVCGNFEDIRYRISDMKILQTGLGDLQLVCCGRDGVFRRFAVNTQENFKLSLMEEKQAFSNMGNVEGIISNGHSENIHVWGLWNNFLVIQNISDTSMVLARKCPKNRRAFAVHFGKDITDCTIAHSKDFLISSWISPSPLLSMTSLKALCSPLHGLEINCSLLVNHQNKLFLITGSRDTCIVLSACDQELSTSFVQRVEGHVGTVRSFAMAPSYAFSDSILVFSGGGQSRVRLHRLKGGWLWPLPPPPSEMLVQQQEMSTLPPAVQGEDTTKLPEPSPLPTAADNAHSTETVSSEKNIEEEDITECKITSMICFHVVKSIFCLICGSSDARFSVLTFDEITNKYTLIGTSDFHTSPILSMAHFSFGDSRHIVVSGGNDGQIALWTFTQDLFTPFIDEHHPTIKFHPHCVVSPMCHKSGVASIEPFSTCPLHPNCNTCCLFACGGDDQAVSAFHVTVSNFEAHPVAELQVRVDNTVSLPSADSCAITGISVCGKFVISVGKSQKLCVWEINASTAKSASETHSTPHITETLSFVQACALPVDVPDLACITTHKLNCEGDFWALAAAGNGVQLFKFKHNGA
ncbi:hypothetical protein Pelo_14234 [Pelomyxa schiedti]|nr:hypothetical protein Pelo_14234 [Pelomyxa schiedti]